MQPRLHCLAFLLTFSATEMTNLHRNLHLQNTAVPKSWPPPNFFVCSKLLLKSTLIWGSQGLPKAIKKPRFMGESCLNKGYYLSLQSPPNWKQHQLGWAKKATSCWEHLKLCRIPLESCASRRCAPVSPALQLLHQCQAFTWSHSSDFRWSTVCKHTTKLICTALVSCPAS